MSTEYAEIGANPTRVDTGWIPDDPAMYRTTAHFDERHDSRDRIITRGLASEVIASGDPSGNRGGWQFAKEIDGIEVKVICKLEDELTPMANTGYGVVTDLQTARDGQRWSEREITCERLRNAIFEAKRAPWPEEVRQINTEREVTVRGHPVVTRAGSDEVRCLRCDEAYTSWELLTRIDCQ